MDSRITRQTMVLPISTLHIPEYQRNPAVHNRRILRAIVTDFKPHLFHNVRVNLRDGMHVLYDGGTRKDGAVALGIESLTCEVTVGMTEQEEREAFALQGTASSTSVQEFIKFWAMHGGGSEREVAIADAVEKHGFKITKRGETGPNVIKAVRALERTYDMGYLDDVLNVLANVWPEDVRKFDARIILGLAVGFLYRYREYDIDFPRLIAGLNARSFIEAYNLMTEFKRTSPNDAHGQVWGKTFVTIYNQRRRKRLPNWNEV